MHTIHRLSFEDALASLERHATTASPPRGDVRVITIDGRAGAGKSTMAQRLSSLLDDAPIVHMDDLYRGWDDALTARLAATLKDQILLPITMGKMASFRPWDWNRMEPAQPRTIPRHDYLILEGVGASQRVVRPFVSTMAWIEVNPEIGLERVLRRDSAIVADLDDFTRRMRSWQGAELLHFERENTFDASHLRFDGELFA